MYFFRFKVATDKEKFSHRCFNGFSGDNCSQPVCTSLNNCSGQGVCIEAEFCKCYLGYNGADCSNYSCEAVNHCSGKWFIFGIAISLKHELIGYNCSFNPLSFPLRPSPFCIFTDLYLVVCYTAVFRVVTQGKRVA